MEEGFHVLGLDGGGTWTRCIIIHSSGTVVARGEGGPSNPITIGNKTVAKNIISAINEASGYSGIKKFRASCLGIAGADRLKTREELKRLLPRYMGEISIVSDAESALSGAICGKPGVVVISGTGSIAYGFNSKGRKFRAGGWGWKIGDEGSGYSIGKDAIQASLKSFDGRAPFTSLSEKIAKKLNLECLEAIIDWVYSENRRPHDIASLSPLVADEAGKGDIIAGNILRKAGLELAEATLAVINRLKIDGSIKVALNGGVFNFKGPLIQTFKDRVKEDAPQCVFINSRFQPYIGSALIAFQNLGMEINEKLLNRIEKSLKEI